MAEPPWVYGPHESAELLALAEQIGRIGLIDWQVPAGTMRMSATALAMYGLENFDGRYDTWIATVHREDRARLRGIIENAFEARAHEFELEFRIVRQMDKALRWIEARRLVFYDAAGAPRARRRREHRRHRRKRQMVELRNFTEALEAAVKERTRELEAQNEARRKAEEQLRQAQKMEAVGQLTGGIAHDFNNLLTVILGGLDSIGRQIPALPASPAKDRIARAKDMALQGVRRAVTLTSRLLAFSRQQPLEPKPVDANRLIADTADISAPDARRIHRAGDRAGGRLWRTHADPNQLENAILNLAVNARDAMPNGGKMTIETANCYLDDAYVTAAPEPIESGQYVMIAVADTGHGMDRPTLERVFEPFFTTKEVGRGTGLGLSQVYGFVHQSAGHVKIYSEVGEGTTAKIYLPRYIGEDEKAEDDLAPRDSARAIGAESILVVEDDDALRVHSVETLRELGYRVLTAPNGAAALDILSHDPQVDLLFTDIVMPGALNGRQLADEATRRRPGLKVLFTTGYTRNAIVHHGRLDPGVQLIVKPFSYEELGAKIRALLDGQP